MPYKVVQEERSKKIVFDPLTSSAFMPISTVDAFDTNHKTFTGLVQKNFIDRQGGTHYTMIAYPVQDNVVILLMPKNMLLINCQVIWFVKGEKGRRIRELASIVQKRFKFPKNSVELYAEKVNNKGLCACSS
ncbi:hypothetical protein IFM89_005130 [Coptis chinensis]|uniref:Uncharacterized protein n=1 Tax=Coptis chinensis TaxID=261450 RepID=A0A835IJV3_9MAGN|nr:hypothetical protein IFM89_005130 [Coptis chinensis]